MCGAGAYVWSQTWAWFQASHDQTLRLWSFAGETLAELVGHTALIYSAAAHASSGLIASASEDNTARLWRGDGSCLQSLPHPRMLLLHALHMYFAWTGSLRQRQWGA